MRKRGHPFEEDENDLHSVSMLLWHNERNEMEIPFAVLIRRQI